MFLLFDSHQDNIINASTVDPVLVDTVEENEDIEPEEENMNEEVEGSNDDTLNNDFCFTNDDFIEYYTEINGATRRQGKFKEAWATIK